MVDDFTAAGYAIDALPDDGSVRLVGDSDINDRPMTLEIVIEPAFPFVAPKVRAVDGSGGNSWHQEPGGWLCLWDQGQTSPSTWCSHDAVINRVRAWFTEADAGWSHDAPDLDLERYWPLETGLVLYNELPNAGWVRLSGRTVGGQPVWEVKGNGGSNRRNRSAGFVVDIGEPDRPPRTMSDLIDSLDEATALGLESHIQRRQLGWLLCRYRRHGNEGVLALRISDLRDHELTAVRSAGSSSKARMLRAGSDSAILAQARVLVIGLGAVGSFVADGLARAGTKGFTLVDADVLLPGNVVRHMLNDDMVGMNKALAMRRHLIEVRGLEARNITATDTNVRTLEDLVSLLTEHSVAVEATGDLTVAALVGEAARIAGKPAVSAAIGLDGRVVRVDRWPLAAGESFLPDPILPPSTEAPIYDNGCGSAISPTPPWAVALAGSHAVRAVTSILRGDAIEPSYLETLVSISLSAVTPS